MHSRAPSTTVTPAVARWMQWHCLALIVRDGGDAT